MNMYFNLLLAAIAVLTFILAFFEMVKPRKDLQKARKKLKQARRELEDKQKTCAYIYRKHDIAMSESAVKYSTAQSQIKLLREQSELCLASNEALQKDNERLKAELEKADNVFKYNDIKKDNIEYKEQIYALQKDNERLMEANRQIYLLQEDNRNLRDEMTEMAAEIEEQEMKRDYLGKQERFLEKEICQLKLALILMPSPDRPTTH